MITKELLREWSACWNDARLTAAFGERTAVTPREIAEDKSVSLDDRMWVLARTIWYLDERAARMFAIETAMTVVHLAGTEEDQDEFRSLMNTLATIEDLPADQRDAARGAAWDAARGAAWDAAWDAARGAAWDAARDAARGAARAAAWAAAWDAAWDAARAAAWAAAIQASIDRAIEWLGDYAEGWE